MEWNGIGAWRGIMADLIDLFSWTGESATTPPLRPLLHFGEREMEQDERCPCW
jgi:hypothetical protein